MCFSATASEVTEVLRHMFRCRFVAVLGDLDTLRVTKMFGRAKTAEKCAKGTKDQAVTGNDPTIGPKVPSKRTKLRKNIVCCTFFSLVLVPSLD